MRTLAHGLALLLFAATAAQAAPPGGKPALRYIKKVDGAVPTNVQVHSAFQEGLGAALARQMGRQVEYLQLPRKRLAPALENGEGDIACSYTPDWLPGAVNWSRPFIPISDVVLSSPRVPAPASLEDLRGGRIGTVLGFSYPQLEQTLGADFVRDDAPTTQLSMRKWLIGRFDYIVAAGVDVEKQAAQRTLPAGSHVLPVFEVQDMCAISRSGRVSLAELNAAIDALEKSGELARLLKLR